MTVAQETSTVHSACDPVLEGFLERVVVPALVERFLRERRAAGPMATTEPKRPGDTEREQPCA